jgi:hypothetical protein
LAGDWIATWSRLVSRTNRVVAVSGSCGCFSRRRPSLLSRPGHWGDREGGVGRRLPDGDGGGRVVEVVPQILAPCRRPICRAFSSGSPVGSPVPAGSHTDTCVGSPERGRGLMEHLGMLPTRFGRRNRSEGLVHTRSPETRRGAVRWSGRLADPACIPLRKLRGRGPHRMLTCSPGPREINRS